MKILCQEEYDKALEFAEKTNDLSLQRCMDRLKSWEYNSRRKCEITLYSDTSPYSFGFCEKYENGDYGIVGGLLYHGSPDQSFAVQIQSKIGWSIHT